MGYLARNFGRRFALADRLGVRHAGRASSPASRCCRARSCCFCVGTFGCGFYAAAHNSYRFAAADTASDDFKPKAISWVLAGGVLAGIIGPQS